MTKAQLEKIEQKIDAHYVSLRELRSQLEESEPVSTAGVRQELTKALTYISEAGELMMKIVEERTT